MPETTYQNVLLNPSSEIAAKRREVTSAYPGEKWRHQVARMKDDQIIAIWLRLFGTKEERGKKTERRKFIEIYNGEG